MNRDNECAVDRVPRNSKTWRLGFISAMSVARHHGQLFAHLSFGRIVDELAHRCDQLILSVPLQEGPPPQDRDYLIRATNVTLVPQPYYRGSMQSLAKLRGIVAAYRQTLDQVDDLFIRGMVPAVGVLYLICRLKGVSPCHWIVGDAIKLLQSHRRSGRIKDWASLLYAFQDRAATVIGQRLTGGSLICNGQDLAQSYRGLRCVTAVSTTLLANEFHLRADTCRDDSIRLLFVGFVRPEKGLEYLIQAVAKLPPRVNWHLNIVGPTDDYPDYHAQLLQLTESLGVNNRITWLGYIAYGDAMWRHLRESDIFVLPTLSEGTPRVLVEARANSLPIVATKVGGIPTSVTNEHDGLLVPPKDSDALASAIIRIIDDPDLRQRLIRSGLQTAGTLTVDRFVDLVVSMIRNARR